MRLPDRSSGSASPRFSRQRRIQGGFVAAHDDPGVGAADEGAAALERLCPHMRFHASTSIRNGFC